MHLLFLAMLTTSNGGSSISMGVAKYGDPGRCGTDDLDHDIHADTAINFSYAFEMRKAAGLWNGVRTHLNEIVFVSHYTDTSEESWGKDGNAGGIDNHDVLFLHTHGSHNENGSRLVMGSNNYSCRASTRNHIRLGDGDLNIAVIKACQSGDYELWSRGKYDYMIAGSEFTMWNAFHGNSSCGGDVLDYVIDYTWSSMDNGVGENWLDAAYDSWGNDDCPVSIVWGDSKSKRDNFYHNAGFDDRKDTGSKTGSTIYYIAGCDPTRGIELPE